MSKGRLEAFSDGVIAILITIMVLELRPPQGDTLEALRPLTPVFLSYVLSFANLGIYWNNHHHLLQAARVIDGRVLWANLHLLFWLSLLPFATAWMGQNPLTPVPTAAYGLDLLLAAIAYTLLMRALMATRGQAPALREAMGDDRKGLGSLAGYVVATPVALVAPVVSVAIYALIAVIWTIPDRRIERTLVP